MGRNDSVSHNDLLNQFFETIEWESPYDEDSDETHAMMRELYMRDERTWGLADIDEYRYDDLQGEYIYALIYNAYQIRSLT